MNHQQQQQQQQQTPHIILLASPGVGHVTPLVSLAKLLVSRHHFSVTITVPSNSTSPSPTELSILNSLPTSISSIVLPPVALHGLPADAQVETLIWETMSRSLPALRDVFATLSTTHSIAALVVDLFGADALILGNEFNALPFIFYPTNATTLSLVFHLPDLDRAYSVEYRDLTDPITLPGCPPFLGTDLVDPMQDRTNDSYKWLLHMARGYMLAKGVLVNTFYELESQVIEALIEENLGTPPLYPIGPITQTDDSHLHNNDCLGWLDKQPEESVLYISFGSGGTLSCEQVFELAYGLEQSGQRFLWVLRSPNNEVANASFFGENVDKVDYKDPLSFLPKGFLERTNGLGLVVRSWAPQIEVLSHGSTGGFMSHCGWNSTLESVCKGVPFIAWPLYAEQRMNGRLLGDVWGVALRVKIGENGMVGRDEIGRIVRSLMEGVEGKRVRDRVRELKSKAALALREDGSSSKALEEVAIQWRKHVGNNLVQV